MTIKKGISILGIILTLSGCKILTFQVENAPRPESNTAAQNVNTANPIETSPNTNSTDGNTNSNEVNTNIVSNDNPPIACADIVNATFNSVKEYGCGMVPAGQPATPCHYELKFFADRYEWGHDDTIDIGPYSCANNVIEATNDAPPRSIRGSYNPATGILLWEGAEYRKL